MILAQTGWFPIGPKTNDDPTAANAQQLPDLLAEKLERLLADRGLEHDQREQHLQPEAPGDRSHLDGAAVRRERVGDEADQHADQSSGCNRAMRLSPQRVIECHRLLNRVEHERRRLPGDRVANVDGIRAARARAASSRPVVGAPSTAAPAAPRRTAAADGREDVDAGSRIHARVRPIAAGAERHRRAADQFGVQRASRCRSPAPASPSRRRLRRAGRSRLSRADRRPAPR